MNGAPAPGSATAASPLAAQAAQLLGGATDRENAGRDRQHAAGTEAGGNGTDQAQTPEGEGRAVESWTGVRPNGQLAAQGSHATGQN